LINPSIGDTSLYYRYIPSHPQSLFATLTNLSLSVYPQRFSSLMARKKTAAAGPCRPGYSSWSPPPTSSRTDGDKCRASWQWGLLVRLDPMRPVKLPDLLILYPVLVTVVIHRVRNDSIFSPEIPEDASTRQFLEHHRSLRPRADGVQDLFEGLQQVGMG